MFRFRPRGDARLGEYGPHSVIPETPAVREGCCPESRIGFDLAEAGRTTLVINNLLGQKVHTLVNEPLARGSHSYRFDAAGLPSGVYIYRLEAGDFVSQKKMISLK